MNFYELGKIARSVGESNFYRNIMDYIGTATNSEVNMVMRYSRSTTPTYVVHDEFDESLMKLYLDGLYRLDPVYKYCKGSAQPGVFTLDSLGISPKENAAYSRQFLNHVGMADDLIMLFPAPAFSMIALIFERSAAFSSDKVKHAQEIFPLLLGLQEAHERMQIRLLASSENSDQIAYRIFDNKDKVVFESVMWTQILAKEPALRAQVNQVKPRKHQAVLSVPGYVIRPQLLEDEYPAAPGGCLLILEQGNPGMPPVSPLDALEAFGSTVLTPREYDIVKLIFLDIQI